MTGEPLFICLSQYYYSYAYFPPFKLLQTWAFLHSLISLKWLNKCCGEHQPAVLND